MLVNEEIRMTSDESNSKKSPRPIGVETHLRAIAIAVIIILTCTFASAHPMVENALDLVIAPNRITIDARISREQVLLVEASGAMSATDARWRQLIQAHAPYVQKHLRLRVDGKTIACESVKPMDAGNSPLVGYHLEYALPNAPRVVQLDQSFLREFNQWTASCILRVRQSTSTQFDTGLLSAQQTAEFECEWGKDSDATPAAQSATTQVKLWPTVRAYVGHGIMHILTGYDHLLFISALVLATESLWDLIKVVTAFTIAHTLTLTLSVFNLVTLSEHVVEPMIALSIIIVAVQNIFWPSHSRGWTRLIVAFAFGLFHGLGFAGGLKDAMAGMPAIALWAALISFSLGVELAHQMVVIPLYGGLQIAKHWNSPYPRLTLAARTRQIGSLAISLAGIYFLTQAIAL